MPIIDMRVRPPTPEFKKQHQDHEKYLAAHYPYPPSTNPIWRKQTLEDCVKEMEELDLTGVVVARSIPATTVPNEHVKMLGDKYPKRFIPIGGVDVSPANRRAAQDEIDRIAKVFKFKGIGIEPGFCAPPMLADDRRLYPIYAQVNDLGLILGIEVGSYSGPTAEFSSPLQLQRVAMDFPKMQITIYHGAGPYVEDMVAMMTRFKNLWCSPGSHVRGPGGDHYMAMCSAPRTMYRMLYESAWPYGIGLKAQLDWYKKNWTLTPEVAERYFYKNAAELFGIKV